MYRRILLCYDGTIEGRRALREGAKVAIAMRAETHLLAVCRSMLATSVPEGVTAQLMNCEEDVARALLNEGVEKLKAHGLVADGSLAIGDPMKHIPAAAQRLGADLVVVGHRQRGRLARWWSDSPGHTLLNLVHCSILVASNADDSE
jgi:nucleotide-binding universal stress UspA family protein